MPVLFTRELVYSLAVQSKPLLHCVEVGGFGLGGAAPLTSSPGLSERKSQNATLQGKGQG